MNKNFVARVFVTVVSLAFYGCTTYESHEWRPRDMHSNIKEFVEADLKPGSPICGLLKECKFKLHYFFGTRFDPTKKWANVLYISGGPGDIVDRDKPYLDFMRIPANFYYFDVRGTGFSTIPESNVYDQFLRAKYVVEDIEALRKKVLDECSMNLNGFPGDAGESAEKKCKQGSPKAWDAIYAHSWGTIIAQRYAADYPDMVGKLILSAPVSRGHGETETARRKMIVDNLIDIYRKQRVKGCPWPDDDPVFKPAPAEGISPSTDTFCFLDKRQIAFLGRALTTLLYKIEKDYGSITFVRSSYSDLRKDDEFQKKYPYPKRFFYALRQLEFLGAGEQEGMRFDQLTMMGKMNAAFLLGYYLMLSNENLLDPADPLYPGNPDNEEQFFCKIDAPFIKLLPRTKQYDNLRDNFCTRISTAAIVEFRSQRSVKDSLRARSVFSIYDGLARWIFGFMEQRQRLDNDKCFSGKDLEDVATGALPTNKVMQDQARKMGIVKNEKICPWDPNSHRHEKETLILMGDADAVTAGGQAEYFYNNGLMPGKRVLVKFPGAGHSMNLQVRDSRDKNDESETFDQQLYSLVYLFLNETIDEFTQDSDVDDLVKALGAKTLPPITPRAER